MYLCQTNETDFIFNSSHRQWTVKLEGWKFYKNTDDEACLYIKHQGKKRKLRRDEERKKERERGQILEEPEEWIVVNAGVQMPKAAVEKTLAYHFTPKLRLPGERCKSDRLSFHNLLGETNSKRTGYERVLYTNGHLGSTSSQPSQPEEPNNTSLYSSSHAAVARELAMV